MHALPDILVHNASYQLVDIQDLKNWLRKRTAQAVPARWQIGKTRERPCLHKTNNLSALENNGATK
jgi:hypothetical protein